MVYNLLMQTRVEVAASNAAFEQNIADIQHNIAGMQHNMINIIFFLEFSLPIHSATPRDNDPGR